MTNQKDPQAPNTISLLLLIVMTSFINKVWCPQWNPKDNFIPTNTQIPITSQNNGTNIAIYHCQTSTVTMVDHMKKKTVVYWEKLNNKQQGKLNKFRGKQGWRLLRKDQQLVPITTWVDDLINQ